MLMGVDKKDIQERLQDGDELNSTLSLRSQGLEIDHTGVCCSESCKDVDVVSVAPWCLTSTAAESLAMGMGSGHTLKDQPFYDSRNKFQDDSSLDYDRGLDNITVLPSVFEFQKAERGLQRAGLAPFFKAPPSKWDDAQKWIASPTTNQTTNRQLHVDGGVGLRKNNQFGYGSRQTSTKVVLEVPDQMLVTYEEPDTKRMELSQEFNEAGWLKPVEWEGDPYRSTDSYNNTVVTTENFVKQSAINLSRHGSSMSIHSGTTIIPLPSTARSVSMRDMGTEMTPMASQEPSRTGTPVRATTPIRSPTPSQPSTPRRASLSPYHSNNVSDSNKKELSEKEMQIKTRREIMLLGTQLGKMNIAAWASKEEEGNDASTSPKNLELEKQPISLIETRAAAWEEAEKAKCMARFNQEEIKIHAWENLEIAKNEAEMRKIEVHVERMSARAHDKLKKKLAAIRLKAEEKLAAAESERNRQGAKTEKQADYIRKTGQIPSSFSCCGWWRS
ncbi:Remorin like [Heracleum sosnowskyi]|uniref:Remorin like n=1 Tax=Heracleum sosnowskyi TaxID=360622 RepID=A0AAD8IGA4_9APIA|nr:Remorin like [Heracleum sosnowskyi]